jgi:uncharacterized protein YbaP (TraB family)
VRVKAASSRTDKAGVTRSLSRPLSRFPVALLVACLVSAGALLGAQAPASVNRGLIWKVEKGAQSGWLVGSLHLLTADAYPLPPSLDTAFAAADVLVEEANPEELKTPTAALQLVAKAMYPPGTTLQSQVSKDTFDKIAKRAERLGLPIERLQSFKPWMVALTLVGLELQKGGFDPGLGLDQHFLNRAPAAGKQVRTLETAMQQIDFLESLSPQLQEGLVAASLEGAETELAQVQRIAAAWKAGDTAPIERLLLTDMKNVDAAVYDTLLVGRNRRWVPQIEDCLSQKKCFVVVGAAHLVGPDSVVAMLRAKGYTITQQ